MGAIECCYTLLGSAVRLSGGLACRCQELGLVGKYHSSVKCRQETVVQVLALPLHLQHVSVFGQVVLQDHQAPVGELQVVAINDRSQ